MNTIWATAQLQVAGRAARGSAATRRRRRRRRRRATEQQLECPRGSPMRNRCVELGRRSGPRTAPRSAASASARRVAGRPSAAARRRRSSGAEQVDAARLAGGLAGRRSSAARRSPRWSSGMSRGAASGWIAQPPPRPRRTATASAASDGGAALMPASSRRPHRTSAGATSIGSRAGSSMTKRAPGSPSLRSSTHTRPPCMRTCSSTSARPSPAPSLPLRRPARDAAGEALEDQRPLLDGHARAVVLDGDLDVGQRLVVGVGAR